MHEIMSGAYSRRGIWGREDWSARAVSSHSKLCLELRGGGGEGVLDMELAHKSINTLREEREMEKVYMTQAVCHTTCEIEGGGVGEGVK